MKLTDERIFELLSEHTTYEVQGPDEDPFGVPTVMNKWGQTMYASRFIDFARAIEAELEKQAPRWISTAWAVLLPSGGIHKIRTSQTSAQRYCDEWNTRYPNPPHARVVQLFRPEPPAAQGQTTDRGAG